MTALCTGSKLPKDDAQIPMTIFHSKLVNNIHDLLARDSIIS